jgi:putative salt-induced outer membrane protein YdiY
MRARPILSIALGIATLFASGIVRADQVNLLNGDRLTGTVLHKNRDILILRTAYAGELRLSCTDLASVYTDAPVDLLLDDGTTLRARLAATPGDTDAQPTPELAQIRFINPTPDESGIGYAKVGHLGLALSQTRGNSTDDQYHGDGELVLRASAHRVTIAGDGNYGRDGGVASTSNWRTNARYDRFYAPKEFLYGKIALENNRYKDVRLRSVTGGGYGHQLYEDDTTTLSVRGGLSYVDVSHYELPREGYGAVSWGIDFRRRLRMFPGELFHNQEGRRGMNGRNGTVLQTRTGLRLPLGEQFNATAQVNADWESQPTAERKKTDTTVMIGLGYAFH